MLLIYMSQVFIYTRLICNSARWTYIGHKACERSVSVNSPANVQLADLAERIATLKSEKSHLAGQVEGLETQRTAVEKRCRDLGVEPDALDEMITAKEQSLFSLLQSVEKAVSGVELKRDEVHRVRNSS